MKDVIVVAIDKENFQPLIDRAVSWADVALDLPDEDAEELVDALASYNIYDLANLEGLLQRILK